MCIRDSVYTALRTFEHNKFLYLNRHLARTERSMALLGWTYRLDRARLLRALHGVVTAAPWPEMRVRIDVLATPVAALPADTTAVVGGRELIALQPFTPPPPELYETGVAVGFAAGLARERPLAKTADFAARRPMTGGLGQSEDTKYEIRDTSDELRVTSDELGDAPDSSLVTRHSSLPPYEYLLLDSGGRILELSLIHIFLDDDDVAGGGRRAAEVLIRAGVALVGCLLYTSRCV